ncbi:carbohydrate kinase-like protein, partial [candidate division WOR-1 bacterium DG_54_3]
DPSGKAFTNPTGNPGMASGGVGDVLTGMIAGFIAQRIDPWEASLLAVYLHGLAGDLAAREKGEYGMIATDLVEKIPHAIQRIY